MYCPEKYAIFGTKIRCNLIVLLCLWELYAAEFSLQRLGTGKRGVGDILVQEVGVAFWGMGLYNISDNVGRNKETSA